MGAYPSDCFVYSRGECYIERLPPDSVRFIATKFGDPMKTTSGYFYYTLLRVTCKKFYRDLPPLPKNLKRVFQSPERRAIMNDLVSHGYTYLLIESDRRGWLPRDTSAQWKSVTVDQLEEENQRRFDYDQQRSLCALAAKHGQLDMLKTLLAHQYSLCDATVCNLIERGDLETLRLLERQIFVNKRLAKTAVRVGNMPIIEWMHAKECKYLREPEVIMHAVKSDKLQVLQFMKSALGVIFHCGYLKFAIVCTSSPELITWLQKEVDKVDPKSGHYLKKWLSQNGYQMPSSGIRLGTTG